LLWQLIDNLSKKIEGAKWLDETKERISCNKQTESRKTNNSTIYVENLRINTKLVRKNFIMQTQISAQQKLICKFVHRVGTLV